MKNLFTVLVALAALQLFVCVAGQETTPDPTADAEETLETTDTTEPSNAADTTTSATNTTNTTGSTAKPPCTKPPHCAAVNFQAMAKTCCKVPLPDLLAINIKNKVAACGAIGHQIFFNLYHLHKLQDVRNGNKIDFKGKLANSPLAIRAACFVNCYLKSLNLLVNGTMTNKTFNDYFGPKVGSQWNSTLAEGFTKCSNYFYNQSIVFEEPCNANNLAVIQCVHKYAIAKCPSPATTNTCIKYRTVFDQCNTALNF